MTVAPRLPHGWNLAVELPVRTAKAYDLAHLMVTGMPHLPTHPPYAFSLTKRHGDVMYEGGVSAAAEVIVTGGHVGTHIDAFCHFARDGRVYGGQPVAGAQSYAGGITVAAVHELQPIIGPGHLVDLPRLLGRDARPEDELGATELGAWFASRTEPGPGSVVLVRTGWGRFWDDSSKYLGMESGCPGVALSGARWLSERGVLATGADTVSYERTPEPGFPVHVHLLVESGVPIMEAMNLEFLAGDGVLEFFFVAVPLALGNATGSPIRPVALV